MTAAHSTPFNSSAPLERAASHFSVQVISLSMILQAYAKINLGLRIIARRADGFHAIETVFHRIALSDEITLTATGSGIELTCSDAALPADETNLCWKAAECIRRECGTRRGVSIRVEKRIPMGAGLGGGSSDAAVILKHLPRLWETEIAEARLRELGASIGSDVVFFLQNSSAYAEGRGEILTPFALSLPYWILLVNPGIHVSTPWAYKEFSKKLSGGLVIPRGTLYSPAARAMAPLDRALVNDFEDVVFPEYPAVRSVKDRLLASGAAYALMSGSGSSVFGLFEHRDDAIHAQELFEERMFTSLTEPHFKPAL